MKKWINYQQLNYFKTIAKSGSILAASKILGVGQPTLSIQLKQLEEIMGVTLFERHHKKLKLTDDGAIVLKYANEIFYLGDELLKVLNNEFELPKKHFHIGALDTIPKHATVSAFECMQSITPSSIEVSEGSADYLIKELLNNNLDLIISNFVPSPKKGEKIYHQKISEQKVLIVGTEKFSSLSQKFPKSLNESPFILPTNPNKLRVEIDKFFNGIACKYDLIAETQDTSLQKLLALQGHGVMVAPEIAIEEHLLKGEFVIIGEMSNVDESFYLLYTENKLKNPHLQDFIKTFKL